MCRTGRVRVFSTVLSLCVAVSLIAACGADTPPGQAASTDGNPNADVANPLPDNAVDDAVARLDELVTSLMDDTGIPGMAVAVVSGGSTVYAEGFGVRDIATGGEVGTDTVFPVASMSKSIGSTVIASLVTDGVVDWSTPVTDGLPWFALADPAVTETVTIADLYAHRSGLPEHAGDKLEDMGYPQRTILERLRYVPLDPFRISYHYTNFGLTAAAESAAALAGEDWATLSERTLYAPLGMNSTSSRFDDFVEESDRVVGHVNVDGEWVTTPEQRDPDAQSPAGGVSSSVDDLAVWLTMLLGEGTAGEKTITGAEELLPAITPQIVNFPPMQPDARAGFYGYGFNAGVTAAARTTYSHSGAFALGAATNFLVIPSADVAIVALSNAAPVGAVEALTAEFADLVQFGDVRQDWRALYTEAFTPLAAPFGSLVGEQPPTDPAPAQPLADYLGTYDNALYGPVEVRLENGQLHLAMGPDGVTGYELSHWDGNTFTFEPRDENAVGGSISMVSFEPDAERPRMVVEYFDDNTNDGVFVRQ